ncbi:protein MIZU-KUSSEI 1 [Gastrolobium bilobum]|uniref:protein MIZU-KUSSEI 1 n=1 Tax=Gastrolobium bilobum TaxID=150636 RepID=UPI002AB2F6D9|nr:protein MIZU-KUSSEI 1 [Gastrolobium bilobum]
MGEPRSASSSQGSSTTTTLPPSPPPLPSPQKISLVQPSQRKKHKPKVVRVFRSVFRSLPIITPSCKFPSLPMGVPDGHHKNVNSKVSGTLFGYHKGRVSLSVQENPRCFPSLVLELSMQTNSLQKEMAAGMVRIALECEKRPEKDKTTLIEEPLWTMYCNGKKIGYGVRREAKEEDLNVMELLRAVSMGAGVLPGKPDVDEVDGELVYMRAPFEHVVGSKDSETLYMLSPEGNSGPGPELTVFFVRI